MAKVILSNVASLTNEQTAVATINNNSAAVAAAIENTLSRDGTSPNQMNSLLDMNSHPIINLPPAVTHTEPIRKAEFDSAVLGTYTPTYLTPEQFGAVGNGTTDCTAAFASMSTALANGAVVNFEPNAVYKIWPAGTTPSFMIQLMGKHGITFNFNGARFTTDNTFIPNGSPFVFLFTNCQDITINDPWYVQTAYTTLDSVNGGQFISIGDGSGYSGTFPSSNFLITNMRQTGGRTGFVVAPNTYEDATATGLTILNGSFNSVYYPLSFQNGGDNFFARGISCTNTGRAYFPYGVSNHDVELTTNQGGPFNNVNLAARANPLFSYARRSTSNIRVRVRSAKRYSNSASAGLVALVMQQAVTSPTVSAAANNGSGLIRLTVSSTADMATGQFWYLNASTGATGATGNYTITVIDATHVDLQGSTYTATLTGYMRVPTQMRNIQILLDIDNDSNQQPNALVTYKDFFDGSADTGISNYILENVVISGSIINYNFGIPALDLFNNNYVGGPTYLGSYGTWTGETVRNIVIRDLNIDGTSTSVSLNCAPLQSMILENIQSPTITWTVSDPSNVLRPINCNAGSVAGSRSVTPNTATANQFLTGLSTAGVLTKAQPAVTDLSGLGTGVATFLATPTSANLKAAVSDETGSGGALVFATSPTITTPIISGHPTIEGVTPTGATGSGNMVFATSPTITTPVISGHPTIEGVTPTGATGSGNMVFATSPTLVTPTIGVAAGTSVTLSATGTSMDASGQIKVASAYGVPAGGNAAVSLLFSAGSIGFYVGSGAPSLSATQGSVYLRSDGSSTSTRMYINTNGSTGWTPVTTAS